MQSPEDSPRWQLGYRPALDGVRALAVGLVMAGHFGVPGLRTAGAVGVTVFFVLSGFLITTLLLDERERTGRVSLRNFYARRAYRLLPALVVVVSFYLVVATANDGFDFALPRALAALFYVANWVNAQINLGALFHTWSLGVEEQFYAVWPAILVVAMAIAGRRTLAAIAFGLIAATVAMRAAGISGVGELDRSVDALMIGCLLAVAANAGLLNRWRGNAAIFAGIAGMATLTAGALAPLDPGWREGWTFGLLAVGVASAAVIASICSTPSRLERSLSWRPIAAVGKVSYGLYLWHFIVLWMLTPVIGPFGWIVAAAVMTLASLICAAVSWRYLERPVMRYRSSPRRARVAMRDAAAVPATS